MNFNCIDGDYFQCQIILIDKYLYCFVVVSSGRSVFVSCIYS